MIIILAEKASHLLATGLDPKYLNHEMGEILSKDEWNFYIENIDIIMETINSI